MTKQPSAISWKQAARLTALLLLSMNACAKPNVTDLSAISPPPECPQAASDYLSARLGEEISKRQINVAVLDKLASCAVWTHIALECAASEPRCEAALQLFRPYIEDKRADPLAPKAAEGR